jgi:hypothetical protein
MSNASDESDQVSNEALASVATSWDEAIAVFSACLHPSIEILELAPRERPAKPDPDTAPPAEDAKQPPPSSSPRIDLFAKLKRGGLVKESFISECKTGQMPTMMQLSCLAVRATFHMFGDTMPTDHDDEMRAQDKQLHRIMQVFETHLLELTKLTWVYVVKRRNVDPEMVKRIRMPVRAVSKDCVCLQTKRICGVPSALLINVLARHVDKSTQNWVFWFEPTRSNTKIKAIARDVINKAVAEYRDKCNARAMLEDHRRMWDIENKRAEAYRRRGRETKKDKE